MLLRRPVHAVKMARLLATLVFDGNTEEMHRPFFEGERKCHSGIAYA